jgi:uncharacterized protein (DUF952 family)
MIYHLLTHEAWKEALEKEQYTHPSLKAEGFIHCSTKRQLLPTANRHFAEAEELVVLHIVERRVREILKYEPAANGEEYPHLYGKLDYEAVDDLSLLLRDEAGNWYWDLGTSIEVQNDKPNVDFIEAGSAALETEEPEA